MPRTLRQFILVLAMLMVGIYLFYRGYFTLNLSTPYAIFASLLLYVAEVWGCFLMILYFFQIWDTQSPDPVDAVEGFSVDVLIPTFNEDPELLRGTIEAAKAMDYPHRTYVLDDGHREEVRSLAEELGVNYIARERNVHAKAGNINNALDQTDGELVVILDADHIPQRNFITRLVGYFQDERLAFVQTPHSFYNFDSFQSDLNYNSNHYWEEGELFYNVIQPGKNNWNAVTFCGSAAMFRREALEEVGLIATETITEDIHTGLKLHAAGWRSIFVNERLIVAQAARSVREFATQRLRWCSGNLSIMWHDNPLFVRGLTFGQRMNYLGSMLGWTIGWAKLAIYLTPILLLFTAVPPVDRLDLPLAMITLTYLVVIWTAVKVAGNGHGNLLQIEQMSMNDFWNQIRGSMRALLGLGSRTFVVTGKSGRSSATVSDLHLYLPQSMIIVVGLAAVIWAVVRYAFGLSTDLVGLVVGTMLVALQTTWAWSYLRKAFGANENREVIRHPVSTVYVGLSYHRDGKPVAAQAVTTDISERGVGIIAYRPLPVGQEVELRIRGGAFATRCHGIIRSTRPIVSTSNDDGPEAYRCGIELLDLTGEQLRSLWFIGTQYAVKRQYKRFDEAAGITNESTGGLFDLFRRKPRIHIPLLLGATEADDDDPDQRPVEWRGSVTEWIDITAFEVLVDGRLDEGQPVRFRADTPYGPVVGLGHVSLVAEEVVGGETLHRHQVEMTRFDAGTRMNLQSLLGVSETAAMRRIVRSTPSKLRPQLGRPLVMVAVPALLLAAGLLVAFQFAFRDRLLLDRVAKADPSTEFSQDDRERVVSIYEQTVSGEPSDITDLYRLRNALQNIGEQERADRLAGPILLLDPDAVDTQIAYADSLSKQGQLEAAQRVLEDPVLPLAQANYRQAFANFEKAQDGSESARSTAQTVLARAAATRDRVLLLAARNAVAMQDYNRATELFGQALEPKLAHGLQEQDVSVAVEYAGILVQAGKPGEAVEVLKKVPENPDVLELLAGAASMQRDFETAAEAYRRLLEINPNDEQARQRLADVISWKGDYPMAISIYQRLKQEFADDEAFQEDLRARLGRIYLWDDQFDQALQEFTPLMANADLDSGLWEDYLDAARGATNLKDEQYAVINQIQQRSNQLVDERRLGLLARLADVQTRHGTPAVGILLLEQYLAILPAGSEESVSVQQRLADAYLQTNRPAEALRILESMTPDQRGKEGLRKMASAYLMTQNFESALDVYKQIIDRDPADAEARRWLADVYSWQGQYLQAISQFKELVERHPENDQYRIRLAQVYLWDEEFQQSLATFQPMMASAELGSDLWKDYLDAAAGAEELTQDQTDTVARLNRQADVLAENSRDDLLSRLADVYAKHGDPRQALALLEEILAIGEPSRETKVRLANVMAQLDRPAEALAMLQGLELETEDKFLLAGVYAMLERFDDAVNVYREIAAEAPNDPRVDELLADAHTWNRDHATAVRLYRQLVERDPDNKGLRLKLAQAMLYNRQYDDAVTLFAPLIDPESTDWSVWRDYVDAAAGASSLTLEERELVNTLSQRRDELFEAGQSRLVRRLADVYVEQASPDEAILILQRMLALNPDDRDARLLLADILHDQGLFDRAELHYEILVRNMRATGGVAPSPPENLTAVPRAGLSTSALLAPYRARSSR